MLEQQTGARLDDEAIVSNHDNLSYGNIVSVHTGTDEVITAVTDHGIEELSEMILDARRSPKEWQNFLEDFLSDPDITTCVKDKGPRKKIEKLLSRNFLEKLLRETFASHVVRDAKR